MGNTLVVLRTTAQLWLLNRSVPGWRDAPVTVISGHPTVDIELRQQKVPFESLYDVVPSSLFAGCETGVDQLTGTFTEILRRLWHDEVLVEGLRPNAGIIAQDIVRSRITIEALLEKLSPHGVWVVSNLNVPRILDVELSSDIFDAMLLSRARDRRLPVKVVRRPVSFQQRLGRLRFRVGTSGMAYYLMPLLRPVMGGKSIAPVPPPRNERRRIMLLGADFDFEYQVPLAQKLRENPALETIHIYTGGKLDWVKPDIRQYMTENPSAWVDYRQFNWRYPTRYRNYRPQRNVSADLKEIAPEWQEWLATPLLKFQFKWLFEDAPVQVLKDAERWGTLFQKYQPDTVVLMQDGTYTCAGQSLALKRVGIKTVLLPHAAIVNATPAASRFLSDRAFVWGKIMAEELIEQGVQPERIHITGVIKKMQEFVRLTPEQRNDRLRSQGLDPGRKTLVMVTSGSFERWMRPYVDVKAHLASIEAVIRHVFQRAGVQLIIKTHPRRDYPAVYHDMIERLASDGADTGRVKVIVKADLFEILAVADMVIVPNTHTTASLEALVAEQPIVYLSSARIYDKGFSWVRYGGCLIIDRLEDIPSQLDKVLNDRELREKLIAEGKGLLQRYYDAEGVEAVSRIEGLLSIGREAI